MGTRRCGVAMTDLGSDLATDLATRSAVSAIEETHFIVIGAGGLGCPALLGLVGGGARRLTIIDDDCVESSNLQRQVLYAVDTLGCPKVEAASWRLRALTRRAQPLDVQTLARRLEVDQNGALVGGIAALSPGRAAVVLECSDSPALKFAVHDACVTAGVPLVIGGVLGWRGQAMAVAPDAPERACYRCRFEDPPPPELAPSCASVGVVGAVAGVVGHCMAALALALTGPDRGRDCGRLHDFDLLAGRCAALAPRASPTCSSTHHKPATSDGSPP